MAAEFEVAHRAEQEHDARVRGWLTQLVMTEAGTA
jgi:hypothetical protein